MISTTSYIVSTIYRFERAWLAPLGRGAIVLSSGVRLANGAAPFALMEIFLLRHKDTALFLLSMRH